jgi:DNA-binding NtrC family response regulator
MHHHDSQKRRILFVDDEPAILASLQKLLRKDSERWHMVFALGPRCALDEIRRTSFDVVVSDMQMPEMDGATLLSLIKHESPETVRIMLTGYAEPAVLTSALPLLHQLLNKPCSIAMLRTAIEDSID